MQVIHELDEKKDDPRLGERASRTIKEIKTIRSAGTIVREGVTLEVFNYELRAEDFPTTLSYDSKDDRIVHSVKKYLEQHAGAKVAVYTEDMGMTLRCEMNGVPVVEPDPKRRLENPHTEHEKKYRLAITELNELKNRVPVLEVVVCRIGIPVPTKDRLEFEVSGVSPNRNLEAEFEDYRQHNKLLPMQKTEIAKAGPIPKLSPKHDAVERYNERLEKHLAEYKEWLKLSKMLAQIEVHKIEFSIWLSNTGLAPADDLDLTIEVNEPVVLLYEASSKEAKSLNLPDPPSPPERPQQFFVDMGFMDRIGPSIELPDLGDFYQNKATVEQVEGGKSFRISYSVKRLKHNEQEHVGDLIAVIRPDSVRPFQMQYRITAANLPKPVAGSIPVIVKKGGDTVRP
jgi:hypothetical protein